MQRLRATRAKDVHKNLSFVHPGKLKYLIGGLVVALAAGYLIWSAAGEATAYYMTIPEILSRGPSPRAVRVAGAVVEGSIDLYHGPRPDMFRDGADVVLEGSYTSEGIFEAQKMLLQCPSKYEEAQQVETSP